MRSIIIIFVFSFPIMAFASLSSEQVTAKEEGILLYSMQRFEEAAAFLEVSARAGDRDSQYFLGKIIDNRSYKHASEARYWYELAAHQGHLDAMIRLTKSNNRICLIMQNCPESTKSSDEWSEIARGVGKKRAKQGDREAMFQLYVLTREFHWLEKAAKAGFPKAQYWLSVKYRQGRGFFLIHSNRRLAIEKWLKAAAEAGYVPAMELLIRQFAARKDHKALEVWLERAAIAGSPRSQLNYSALLAHLRKDFRIPLNLVKAYGLALVATQYPSNHFRYLAEKQLAEVAGKMSEKQIEEGVSYAGEWVRAVPSVSGYVLLDSYEFLTLL